MRLHVLATGSAGNAYILMADDGRALLLDAGVPFGLIIRALERPSSLVGVLVTHEHMDHARSARKLMERGIPVVMSRGTWDAVRTTGDVLSPVIAKAGEAMQLGGFTILPFPAEHDAAEPLGFLVRDDRTGEKLMYATDTYYLRNTFPGVHTWLIECNYTNETLNLQTQAGKIPLALRGRLVKSHMSLDRLLDTLRANDLRWTQRIILCHLSDQRSDEQRMVRTVQEQTCITTVAAHAGDTYNLMASPF